MRIHMFKILIFVMNIILMIDKRVANHRNCYNKNEWVKSETAVKLTV